MKTPPGLDRRPAELVAQLDAVARRFMLREKVARDDGESLTRHEVRVVVAVGEKPAWTMGELATRTMLAVSSLTGVVDRLEGKRLVERERSNEDRRAVWVRLTRRGRRRHEEFRRMRLRLARGMLSALNEGEQQVFMGLMRKIGQGVPDGGEGKGRGAKAREGVPVS